MKNIQVFHTLLADSISHPHRFASRCGVGAVGQGQGYKRGAGGGLIDLPPCF